MLWVQFLVRIAFRSHRKLDSPSLALILPLLRKDGVWASAWGGIKDHQIFTWLLPLLSINHMPWLYILIFLMSHLVHFMITLHILICETNRVGLSGLIGHLIPHHGLNFTTCFCTHVFQQVCHLIPLTTGVTKACCQSFAHDPLESVHFAFQAPLLHHLSSVHAIL